MENILNFLANKGGGDIPPVVLSGGPDPSPPLVETLQRLEMALDVISTL